MKDETNIDIEIYYENHYRCFDCGEQWANEADVIITDDCPSCDKRTNPMQSVETTTTVTTRVIDHTPKAG